MALGIEQIDLHAGQRNVGRPEHTIALRIGPDGAANAGGERFAEVVVDAVVATKQHNVAECIGID